MARDNIFGLGIEIELKDGVSPAVKGILASFLSLRQEADKTVVDVDASFNRLQNIRFAGQDLVQLGSQMQNFGQNIIGGFAQAGKSVINVGDDFEKTRMTLEALYKTSEAAEEKMKWLIDYAAKTPFEITDLKGILIGMKAIGLEASDSFTVASGKTQELMSYIGDLGALRPDLPLSRIMQGVRNALGGNVRSLDMILDIRSESVLGRKVQNAQDIADLVDKLGAAGLMDKLSNTWSTKISNMRDSLTKFLLAVSDSGAFQAAKDTLTKITNAIQEISMNPEKMERIGKNVAKVFTVIWYPIDKVVTLLIKVGQWVAKMVEKNPALMQFVLPFVAFGAVSLVLLGTLVKLVGGFMMSLAAIGQYMMMMILASGATTNFATAQAMAFKKLGMMMTGLARFFLVGTLALIAFSVLWKTNFMNMQTSITTFFNKVKNVFGKAQEMMKMDFPTWRKAREDLLALDDSWSRFTLKLSNALLVLKAVGQMLTQNMLSNDVFYKLREAGLLPLMEDLWDLKDITKSVLIGIRQGWDKTSKFIMEKMQNIADAINGVIDKFNKLTGSSDNTGTSIENLQNKIDLTKWEKFGEILGIIFGYLVFKEVIGVIAIIADKFLPILDFVLSKLIDLAVFVLPKLLTVLRVVGTVIWGVFGWWSILIAAVIAGAILVYKNWDKIKIWWEDFVENTWKPNMEALKSGMKLAGDTIIGIWSAIKQKIYEAISAMADFLGLDDKAEKYRNLALTEKYFPGGRPTYDDAGDAGIGRMNPVPIGVINTLASPGPLTAGVPTTNKVENTTNVSSPITFGNGAIQVNMTGASEKEIDNKFVNTLANKLQQRMELQTIQKYGMIGGR